ncbi:MAG: heme ABC transporter ATP-binding protein [Myxococcales bacterium]|nr:heme ABC transporter ATP-binding protein [Myxococcales bacterium]
MLSLLNASRLEGRSRLVDRVTMGVEPGELLAIVGPNGAGKSTVIRMLTGALSPTEGEVRLDGESLLRLRLIELARRRAVVEQTPSLSFDFPVLEVVLLGRHPHQRGQATRADRQIAREMLDRVGLGSFEKRQYTTLSGGERQRVHIARSLAQLESSTSRTCYWLLDEPCSALDLEHQHRVMELCSEAARRNLGVVVVMHDLDLTLRYASRVLVLNHGRVVADGAPSSVFTPGLMSDVFHVSSVIESSPWGPHLRVLGPSGPKREADAHRMIAITATELGR